MFKIRSLFWKIFFAFWTANIAVMLATTYTILELNESEFMQERHREHISHLSQIIINAHEQGVPVHSLPELEHNLGERIRSKRIKGRHLLSITNNDGKVIYQHRPAPPPRHVHLHSKKTDSLEIISSKGKRFKIIYHQALPPRAIMSALHKLNMVKIIFIFVASGLVSLILTLLITRPLKKLGYLSQNLSAGHTDIRVDKKLLRRADEIGELARDFNSMAEKISFNIETQQQLLHDVSHELRAPLARLQAAAALLETSKHETKTKPITTTERIHKECEQIDALIQQVLDYSRLKQITYTFSFFDLKPVIETLIENIQFEFQSRKIEFTYQHDSFELYGIPNLLQKALENIIRNACKYTPNDTKVEVDIKKEDETIIVSIRDYGLGVSNEECKKLTLPFYRSENQTQVGFGLGLSIAARAVEKHNGKLCISNSKPSGLKVTITLPIKT